MTKEQAFREINETQDEYVNELINLINNPNYEMMKTINFTSPTGTGKTKMMSKLINRFPDYYFIITTLSKGQLHLQVRNSLLEDCKQENFYVFGSADYKINSKLQAKDILNKIPENTRCIWLRDEGHIKTNRYEELLLNVCYKLINFSATNTHSDIQCNFVHTMMLRTVNQKDGTPGDAIKKLLEVKSIHKRIPNYNPCAIFRCVNGDKKLHSEIVSLCKKYKLKYIDITDDPFIMAELCKDDNKYDVIINKFKIVEGIDIRRAHILYMDNQPKNCATTIQVIGRCRRNALLYRNDIDIFSPKNKKLLEKTRECFVFYNVKNMEIQTDYEGELQYAFCNYISCEALKPNTTISVTNGQLPNGLFVLELLNQTGEFKILIDKDTGFNIVDPITDFYKEKIVDTLTDSYLFFQSKEPGNKYYYDYSNSNYFYKVNFSNIDKFPIDRFRDKLCYRMEETPLISRRGLVKANVSSEVFDYYKNLKNKYTKLYILNLCSKYNNTIFIKDYFVEIPYDTEYINKEINDFLNNDACKQFDYLRRFISNIKGAYLSYRDHNFRWTSNPESIEKIFNEELFINTLKFYCIKWEKDLNINITLRIKRFLDFIHINYRFLSDYDLDIKDETPDFNKMRNLIPSIRTFNLPNSGGECPNNILDSNTIIARLPLDEKSGIMSQGSYDDLFVKKSDIDDFFINLNNWLTKYKVCYSFEELYNRVIFLLNREQEKLEKGFVSRAKIDCQELIETISEEELELAKKKKINEYPYISISKYDDLKQKCNIRIANDKESAIIGTDLMHQIKINNDEYNNAIWIESKAVTSKIKNNSKFNRYISRRYSNELDQAKSQLFSGENNFSFDKKCNSMLGYCVEYYSKYILYSEEYFGNDIIRKARQHSHTDWKDCIIVRACILKYKELMINSFGNGVSKTIRSVSADQLNDKYGDFVKIVVKLGTKTAKFVKETLYPDCEPTDNVDPNLSIEHITGLADYITHDTILDVKVLNHINEYNVRQVLAYHYLSTKRSDLDIKRLIVYDATSNRSVVINISDN